MSEKILGIIGNDEMIFDEETGIIELKMYTVHKAQLIYKSGMILEQKEFAKEIVRRWNRDIVDE